ncbi:hypothetical protein H072_1712 [Dactylellina haptotyla CBS 200.50]|uniref:BZIP domain-containing protein n=1 Tax=Dactylellina haptotyla (strain CBS 200.50) TaxID=1284197 RepID=S8AN11_DACHA|nr:hypothetical protein H072_1712 [Dactylellina haptotyla CBS 200.50]
MAAAVKESPGSPSSSMSSPEGNTVPDAAAAQKRKGGRKPVYATQEERKMRNRAAQAAFRERRTEYIKHLEATIKQQEETLATLQQSSRSAADEVLMLRYKNSLLERILLEKRIDVHAELKAFTDNDAVPAGPVPSLPPHPPHVQRALHQRLLGRPPQHQFHNQHMGQLGSNSYKKMRRLSESSFFQKPANMAQSPGRKVTSPSVSVEMTSPVTSEPSPAIGGSNHTFLARPSPISAPRRFSHAPDLASLATLYPQQYQAHMDKLDQEYDAEMYDENDAEEDDEHPIDNVDFMTQRNPPMTTGQQMHHLPALSSAEGGPATSQPASLSLKVPNSAADNESMLQQYYSAGSWTVDLFSNPYHMGPLQFPHPFTSFPTSSMR